MNPATRPRLANIATTAGLIVVAGLLSIVLLSLAASSDSNWIVTLVLAGLAVLAVARPGAALIVAAALFGFGIALSHLAGIPSVRVSEVFVVTALWGFVVRAVPRDSAYRKALTDQIAPSMMLFALAAAASTIVWLREQQVRTDDVPAFLDALLEFVRRSYFTPSSDFSLLISTAVILEGLALYVAVRAVSRVEPSFFERALRMFAAGGAGLAVMSVVRLAEIYLRSPGAIAYLRSTPNGLRISPQIPDFIAAGSYFAMCWLIALGLAVASPGRRLAWLAAGAPLVAGLYLTGSRSVIAAAAAGFLVLVLVIPRLGGRSARSVVAVAIAALVLIVGSYQWVTGRDIAGDMAKRSLGIRIELARTALRVIAVRPLFGVGIDRYHLWSDSLASPELKTLFPARKNPHNDLLRISAELGLVGLALFLWILAPAVRAVWRVLRSTRDSQLAGLAGGLAAFGVTSFVSNPLIVPEVSYAFWIALGLAVARAAALRTPAEAPGGIRSTPRMRLVAVLVAAALIVSIPFRTRQELAAIDLERVSYGFFAWDRDTSGTPFRWSRPHATFFVDGKAGAVEIPVAGVPISAGPRLQVELRVDGRVGNRIDVGPDWQILRTLIPAGSPRRAHRIDLHVSPSWIPAEVFPNNTDHRVLGVKVGKVYTTLPAQQP